MSDPRVATSKGWFKIVPNLFMAISFAKFPPNEHLILSALVRCTYGARAIDRCEWSIRKAVKETGLKQRSVERSWAALVARGVVVCYQKRTNKPGIWGVNEEFWNWESKSEELQKFSDHLAKKYAKEIEEYNLAVRATADSALSAQVRTAENTLSADSGCPQRRGQHCPQKRGQQIALGSLPQLAETAAVRYEERRNSTETPSGSHDSGVQPQEVFDYSPFAKDDSGFREKRKKSWLDSINALGKVFFGINEEHKKKLAAFIKTPPPENVSLEAWWNSFAPSVYATAQKVKAEKAAGADHKWPIATTISRWPAEFQDLLSMEEIVIATRPEPERQRARRWVKKKPRMGICVEEWVPCWADEITPEDTARFLQEERAYNEAQKLRREVKKNQPAGNPGQFERRTRQ